ncbi:MAG: heme-binding protein, partial [Chloroflexia bacterium]|nr:heme-binding protein [Chloroflexia bacterium]
GEVLIGGIGVSGSSPENDVAIAEAGVAALQEA